ncbi:MAG: hypothetical protein A2252_00625 [Elusimicrobia bacterium RIFOXYA2_FULL_39_19]|nr:MAG: hypothetical protein A2252_00625 [Elusimicrobia bacterium RIFOXYA2_FULL_39_19]
MNILILEGSKHWTGGAKRAFLTARGLKKLGHNVVVACPPSALLGKKLKAEGMPVYTFMPIGGMGFISFFKILHILRKHNIELLDVHSSVFYRTGGLAGKLLKIKVVFTRNVAFRKNALKKILNRTMYALAGRIITVSQQIKTDLVGDFALNAAKVDIIVDGMNMDEFNVSAQETQKIKKEFGIKDEITAGVVTRMDKTKGHKYLMQAIPEVIAKYPNIKFIITGTGKMEAEIKAQADGLNISKNVIFTGFRSDIPAILSGLDFTVMPSYNEGLGMCILESLSAGKPVVGVNTGGVPEVVIDGYDGVLVNSCTGPELAQGILKILSLNLKELGANGRKLVLEKFSAETMIKKTLEAYNKV